MCAKLIVGAKVIEHQKWGFAEKIKRYNGNVTSQDKANAERKLKEKYLSKSYETYSYPFYGKGARDYDCNFSENKYIVTENYAREKYTSNYIYLYKDNEGKTYRYGTGFFNTWTSSNIIKLVIDGNDYIIDSVLKEIELSEGKHTVTFVADFTYERVYHNTKVNFNRTFDIYLNKGTNYLSIVATLKEGYGNCILVNIGTSGVASYYGYYEDEYRVNQKLQDVSFEVNIVDVENFMETHTSEYYTYEVNVPKKKEYKRVDYSNGYYVGNFRYGKKHGSGDYYWKNGSKYIGKWYKGNMHGEGTYYYDNGDKYVGEWANDNRHGKGTMYYKNGTSKTGDWENDKYVEPSSTNTAYGNKPIESTVKENKFEYKKESYSNGYYEGYFYNGQRNGNGTYYWNNGDKYVGEWKDGKLHGKGVYYYTNGAKYDGPWENDNMHGTGIWYYPDGTSAIIIYDKGSIVSLNKNIQKITYNNGTYYEGEVKNGVCHGIGTYYWNTNDRYEGEFKDGKLHGKGIVYYADGTSQKVTYENDVIVKRSDNVIKKTYDNGYYQGTFKNNLRHGHGTYVWDDGDRYEGDFENDKRNGRGIYYWKNGAKYTGEFKDGKLDGYGIYVYPDGTSHNGYWKNGNKHGKGTVFYPDGTIKAGTWENDIYIEVKTTIKKEVTVAKKEVSVSKKETIAVKKVTPITSNNVKVDINSDEFKEAMKIFAYKVKDDGNVVITSCKNPPKKIVIPEGVTIIYINAFYNNKPQNIEEVVLPNSLVKIQSSAFWKCCNLRKLTLGNSLQEIGPRAFLEAKIDEIYIPDSVKKIGLTAFGDYDSDFKGKISIPKTCKLDNKAILENYTITYR